MRIAVLFDNFGPYHYARLNAAASLMEVIGQETFARSREYEWTTNANPVFERVTLYSGAMPAKKGAAGLSRRVCWSLNEIKPDAVAIPGWSDKASFATLGWCAKNRVPAILMSESTADDESRASWREAIKRRIVSLYSTALVGGERHRRYLEKLGMPVDRVFLCYDAVDNTFFAQGAKKARGQRSEVRSQYGLPENYFLTSARFVEKKNLLRLLKAYAEYRRQAVLISDLRPPTSDIWHLVLIGDGPLKSDLCHLITDLRLQNYVLLPGFKQYDELPVYYGLAKAFVHASTTEQWGLVVNEAMASGLPLIVSNRCGCVPELVHEGVNGFTFDPYNQEQITESLLTMSAMPEEERRKFGEASSQIIARHDVDRFALGLKNAAELAVSLPRKRARFVDRALLEALLRYPR